MPVRIRRADICVAVSRVMLANIVRPISTIANISPKNGKATSANSIDVAPLRARTKRPSPVRTATR
ncbi:hypothetical protein D3C83_291530 [compost metagenome]